MITNSGSNGFFASGSGNGSIVLTGNIFTGNPTGARFQSGNIDLTGTGANGQHVQWRHTRHGPLIRALAAMHQN